MMLRLPTTQLLARLIEDPDLPARVRELSSERFTALVREVGVADAGELVALATTEQLVAAFDEDLFVNARPGEREVFDRRRFVTWLEVLLEAGDDAVARRIEELSDDFVAHALSSVVLVFDPEELRERITSEPEGEDADKALERTLSEEIDGYLLVAREEEGWDAVLALVLALDRRHRALLVRILDRCVTLASSYVDDLDALTEVLSAAESLAEDVEAAREDRRSRAGFVDPRAARSFLALARESRLDATTRDAVTRAYFRDALASLGAAAPTCFDERLRELAYLANVVLAAAIPDAGGRYDAVEAAEVALATVALGAELYVRDRRPAGGRASAAELGAVLQEHPADLLFRRACAVVASRPGGRHDGLVRGRAELDTIASALATACSPSTDRTLRRC